MNTNQLIHCRICKSLNCHAIFLANNFDNLKDSSKFQYFNCCDCNTIFLNTIPKNLDEYYNQNYAPYQRSKKIPKHIKKNIDIIKNLDKTVKFWKLVLAMGSLSWS